MWSYKYGDFSDNQVKDTKEYMRKQIFFLLLYVDEKTKDNYKKVNVTDAFENILTWFGGLNSLLDYPQELVRVMSLLEAAKEHYTCEDFDFAKYRKLVLDAGAEVMKIKEVK